VQTPERLLLSLRAEDEALEIVANALLVPPT
jgi:hypothetical protein